MRDFGAIDVTIRAVWAEVAAGWEIGGWYGANIAGGILGLGEEEVGGWLE
jgi:hypothetical protein